MDYREQYEKIALEQGFHFTDDRTETTVFGSDNGNKVRSEFCSLSKEGITFFAYDMFAPTAYMNNTYCGVYSVLNAPVFECTVLKKVNPLLNFFLNGKSAKSKSKFINDHVDIQTNDIRLFDQFVSEDQIRNYLKVWEVISPIKIVVGKGEDILPTLPDFKDCTVMGIQTNKWIEPQQLIATIDCFKTLL